ncbi:unknown [Bacteroides sp. CAG:1076]|nr:unknown [Bacteroides sp. CAG:1076]
MKKNSIFHLFTAIIFICLGTAASELLKSFHTHFLFYLFLKIFKTKQKEPMHPPYYIL